MRHLPIVRLAASWSPPTTTAARSTRRTAPPRTCWRRPGMPAAIRERLEGIGGSHVLHLLCGSGRETIELKRLGALVTGVDEDEAALDRARQRAPDVPWVHADAHSLPPELLLGRWDLVYLGAGLPRAAPLGVGTGRTASRRRSGRAACSCSTTSTRPRRASTRSAAGAATTSTRVGLGALVAAVVDAGLRLRGLEEWPGRDERIPGARRARRREGLGISDRGENARDGHLSQHPPHRRRARSSRGA